MIIGYAELKVRGQLHDNSCKKKWFEQLCTLYSLCFKKILNLNLYMKEETKKKWDTIIKLAIAILSAIAGAIGASACSVII